MSNIKKTFLFQISDMKYSYLIPKPFPGFYTTFISKGEVYQKDSTDKITSLKDDLAKRYELDNENIVGYWFDGRPVYEKVITFEDASQDLEMGVEYDTIDIIVDHKAFFYNEDKTVQSTANDFASYDLNNMKIYLNNTSESTWSGMIRFKFIKK